MNKKQDILLDVDDVICFPGFLKAVNDFLGTSYEIDDFTDYYFDKVVIPKEQFDEFNHFLDKRNLYDDAMILPNATDVIQRLNELYNIYICSSCINPFNINGSGRLFKDKYDFLISILPFIHPDHYIFTSSKHLFRADIQIDDRLSNLDNDINTRILFPSYHNRNITDEELNEKKVIRAGLDWRNGWNEVANILLDEKHKIYCKK